MGRVLLGVVQVALFVSAVVVMTWFITEGAGPVASATYGFGWQAATGIFVLGAAALVARAGAATLRTFFEEWVWEERAEEIRSARPPRPSLRTYDSSVRPLAEEALVLQADIETGEPLLGRRLEAVVCFKSTLLSLGEADRAALEARGIDPALFARRIDEALAGRRPLKELLEVDRILSTLLVVLAAEIPSAPYRS